jgi:hypothetical protein
MRLRACWLLPLCAFALPLSLAPRLAADDRTEPLNVVRLIDQLGSYDFAEREAATRTLANVGAPALAGLRQAADSQDPEVRRRAIDLVRHIEKQGEAARLLEAKRVRLAYHDTPVSEAVAELARRTGFAIQLEGDVSKLAHRRLTFDTGPVPFWEAFDQFCRKAGVSEPELLPDGEQRRGTNANVNNPYAPRMAYPAGGYTYYNPYNADFNHTRLTLVEGQPPDLPTCTVGAVRLRELPAHVPLPAVLAGSDERLVGLQVAAEPDVAWQGVLALHVTRAVDERGRRLPQPLPFFGSPTNAGDSPYGYVRMWDPYGYNSNVRPSDPRHIPVRLRVGPSVQRLKELEGVVTAQVQTPMEPLLRVEDVTRAVGQTIRGAHGGWVKVVELSRDANGTVRVRGQVAYPPSDEAPPAWLLNSVNPRFGQMVFFAGPNGNQVEVPNLELHDTRGLPFQRLEQPQMQMAGQTMPDPRPRDFRLTFQPRPGQTDPAQLVYVGRRTLILEVPFSLKDVTLR